MKLKIILGIALAGLMTSAAPAQDSDRSITVVLPFTYENLDACSSSNANGLVPNQNIVESLTELDPVSGEVRPRLALSWEQTEPTNWRVTLREGVKYHDGADFNAEAVVASINRLMKPELGCLNRLRLPGETVFSPRAIDTYVVDITTDQEVILMPILMSFFSIESPNTSATELSHAPVGTGPYTVAARDAGDPIVLSRNEDYWGEKPAVEQATFVVREEPALRAAMVDVGEADIAFNVAIQDARETDFGYPTGDTTRLRFTFKPPLDDIRVRRAMNYAVDVEAILDALYAPSFELATQMILPRVNGYDPTVERIPYDPAEAKRLLDEARADGVPVDQEIPLIGRIGFWPNSDETLEAMVQMWADVGLNVKLELLERTQWLQVVNKPYADDRRAMLVQERHDNNSGDASFSMFFRWHTNGQQSEYSDPELDAVIEAADAARGAERTELYQKANRMVAEDVSGVMLFHMAEIMRVGSRIEFEPTAVTTSMFELKNIAFK